MFSPFKKTFSTGAPEFVIVGLGNPGAKYEDTRHNVGFMCIDMLAAAHNIKVTKLKYKSLYGDGLIAGIRCLLVKPSTFMNHSGETVRDIANFYKIPPEKIIIIFDDISLPVGKIRIRRNGSDGGHNGMKSILYLTGKDTFPRIKIGVGAKPHPDYELADWVLSSFKKDELAPLKVSLENACKAAELMLSDKTSEAMNQFN